MKKAITRKLIFFMIGVLCFITEGTGQNRFQRNGIAGGVDDNCFSFAREELFSGGSVFAIEKISTRQYFLFNTRVTHSCLDFQGDGVVFVFQPHGSFIGSFEKTLGYRGIENSIGIELDFEPNPEDNDPAFDHLAIVQHGDLNHETANTLSQPVRILPNMDNVEDCQIHFMTIEWFPQENQLDIYYDCELRISQNMDNTLLSEDIEVYWGVTVGLDNSGHEYTVCPDYVETIPLPQELSICRGDSIRLTSSRVHLNYEWRIGQHLLSRDFESVIVRPDTSSVYSLYSLDQCNKKYVEHFIVEVTNDSFMIDIGPPDTLLCPGETLEIGVDFEDAIFEWNTNSQNQSIQINEEGVYKLKARFQECIAFDSIIVLNGEIPDLFLGDSIFSCEGDVVKLQTNLANHYMHQWSNGDQSTEISVSQSDHYSLEVSNRCGSKTSSVDVVFENCFPVFVPNVFSPNGDGIHDILNLSSQIENVHLEYWNIYNRWGNLVFSTSDKSFEPEIFWDGKMNQKFLEAGVYIYYISIRLPSGKTSNSKGSITLIN